jgi:glycosyltransferase involved in cell wall biosynthesis
MKRIGINLLFINPKFSGGSVTYAKKVVNSIALLDKENRYFIYLNRDCNPNEFPHNANFYLRILPFSYSSVYKRYLWEQIILPFYFIIDRLNIVHSLGYVCPVFCTKKQIVSILDINFKGHGAQMKLFKRILLGSMVKFSAKVSKKIITISYFSKSEIIKHLNIDPFKVTVTHLSGSDDYYLEQFDNSDQILNKYNLRKPYLIAFNSTSPHKNIERLIECFSYLIENSPELNLLLIGHNYKSLKIQELLKNDDLKKRIIFSGFVPDADIRPLLSNAKVFIFPSLYEGFGIPILDAQAYQVPIASSNAGSLPEVGGSGVVYFDPINVLDIVRVVQMFDDNDFTQNCITVNLHNRIEYSWIKTANETLAVYNDLLNE